MARINVEKKNKQAPVWRIIIIGILVVAIIVALYFGFFAGHTDYVEDLEEPATLEQRISSKSSSDAEAWVC